MEVTYRRGWKQGRQIQELLSSWKVELFPSNATRSLTMDQLLGAVIYRAATERGGNGF